MEFSALTESRRTVREYKPGTTVTKEQIEELLTCALQAPSWKNSETGRYYVVLSPEKIEAVKQSCLPEGNRKKCENVPALIVSAFVKNRAGFDREGNPDNELGNQWGAYDLGLQNAYLILKARELGLDTLIMGLRDADRLREELNIPEDEQVGAVIAVGYRVADPAKPKRKETSEIAVYY